MAYSYIYHPVVARQAAAAVAGTGHARSLVKGTAIGYAKAQALLGVMYLRGIGVARDSETGCGFLRASADQGFKQAIALYNDVCADRPVANATAKKVSTGKIPDKVSPSKKADQAALKKRLDDEMARLVKSAEALGTL